MKKTYTYAVAALLATAFTLNAGTLVQETVQCDLLTLKGGFGVDVVSGYTYKGIRIDATPSVQPYLNLRVPFDLNTSLVNSSALFLTGRQFTALNSIKNDWYRSEVTAGVDLTSGSFTLTPAWHAVNSPNGQGGQFQAASVTLNYDDSQSLGAFALNPRASVFYNFNGVAANNQSNGLSYELGVAPGFNLSTTRVTLPVTVGLGSNNFYITDQRYGYTAFGVASKTPLLKNVFLNTSVTYFSTKNALNTNNNHWQVGTGIGVTF